MDAFLRALAANPYSREYLAVLADHLDEAGDPRGAVLRAATQAGVERVTPGYNTPPDDEPHLCYRSPVGVARFPLGTVGRYLRDRGLMEALVGGQIVTVLDGDGRPVGVPDEDDDWPEGDEQGDW